MVAVTEENGENSDKDMQACIRYFFFYHIKLMMIQAAFIKLF